MHGRAPRVASYGGLCAVEVEVDLLPQSARRALQPAGGPPPQGHEIAKATARCPLSTLRSRSRPGVRRGRRRCRRQTTVDCAREGRVTCLSPQVRGGRRLEGNCHSEWREKASGWTGTRCTLRTCTCSPRGSRLDSGSRARTWDMEHVPYRFYSMHIRADHSPRLDAHSTSH